MHDPGTVLYWYDFICPFCYVAQSRNAILTSNALRVVKLPFQAHPDIPQTGRLAGPRAGPMYAMLEREAREAHLPLRWPARLPNTRLALAIAEWVRCDQPGAFAELYQAMFEAHFALGEDLGDRAVIERHAKDAGVDIPRLHAALADGSVTAAASAAEATAREYGVRGTPTWRIGGRMVHGLASAMDFEDLARAFATSSTPQGLQPGV